MERLVREVSAELILRIREGHGKQFAVNLDSKIVRDIVESEVRILVKSGQVIENLETVSRLEQRVTARLRDLEMNKAGEVHNQRSSALEDEWALLARYAFILEKEEEELRRKQLMENRRQQHLEIADQLALSARKKKAEREARRAEQARIEADVKAWRADQMENREAKLEEAKRLRSDREAQLQDLLTRRRLAILLRQAADAHADEQAAQEASIGLARERSARLAARNELDAILKENRKAKTERIEMKRMERERDLMFMEEYAAMLDRQEEDHRARLAKIKERQLRQEADAGIRPPTKKFVDEEVISKQAAEAEKRAFSSEAQKAAKAKEAQQDCVSVLKQQLQERQKVKDELQKQKKSDLEKAKTLALQAAQEVKQRRAASKMSKSKLRSDLDAQVRQKKDLGPRTGMNSIERSLNAKILKEAKEAAFRKKFVSPIR